MRSRDEVLTEIRSVNERESIRWRSHIKYNSWDVWAFCTARSYTEASDKFAALRAYKGRKWVEPASIIPAHMMTTDQQIAFDHDEPDQAVLHEAKRSPEDVAAFMENGLRAAQALMKGALATPGVDLRPRPSDGEIRRLFGKRWQQMRDSGYGKEAAEEEAVEAFIIAHRRLNKEYEEAVEEAKERRLKFLTDEGGGEPVGLLDRD